MASRREGTGGITASHSHEPQGDEPGPRVDGQQLARVENEPFGSAGQLEEVGHPALPAPDLDDVAELHAGRGDLDRAEHRAAECRPPHRAASVGTGHLTVVWHEQSQAS
ncbi:hypothetical protein GCM10027073_52660 [Streptomyces chlorus]